MCLPGNAPSFGVEIKAMRDAQALGYSLADVVDVVQALEQGDFVKSETAHNPLDPDT